MGETSTVTSNVLAVESLDHCAWSVSESVKAGVASRSAIGLVRVSPSPGFLSTGSGSRAAAVAVGAATIVTWGRLGGVRSLVQT